MDPGHRGARLAVIAICDPAGRRPVGGRARRSRSRGSQRIVGSAAPCATRSIRRAWILGAPLGIVFDTPQQIRRRRRDRAAGRGTKAMPLGNATRMTQAERDALGAWIRQGAKISSRGARDHRRRLRLRRRARGGGRAARPWPRSGSCCRSSRGSSTCAGAARRLDPVRRSRRRRSARRTRRAIRPGEIIFYPGGVSETEILFAYGYVAFASKAGALAGNHFATIVEGKEKLRELGRGCSGKARRRSASRSANPLPHPRVGMRGSTRHPRLSLLREGARVCDALGPDGDYSSTA